MALLAATAQKRRATTGEKMTDYPKRHRTFTIHSNFTAKGDDGEFIKAESLDEIISMIDQYEDDCSQFGVGV